MSRSKITQQAATLFTRTTSGRSLPMHELYQTTMALHKLVMQDAGLHSPSARPRSAPQRSARTQTSFGARPTQTASISSVAGFNPRTPFATVHSGGIHTMTKEEVGPKNERFRLKFNRALNKLKKHHALHHPIFPKLQDIASTTGFTPAQIDYYRKVFLARTQFTIPTVAMSAYSSHFGGDESVSFNSEILSDETGHGEYKKAHSHLVLRAHNILGEAYELTPITFEEATSFKGLPESLRIYLNLKNALFHDIISKPKETFPRMTGHSLAHEGAADDMLDGLKPMFESIHGYLDPVRFNKMMEYFWAHDDTHTKDGEVGVEEQHGILTTHAAFRACNNDMAILKMVMQEAINFLDTQAELWDEMDQGIESRASIGKAVRPRPKSAPTKIEELADKSPAPSAEHPKLEETGRGKGRGPHR